MDAKAFRDELLDSFKAANRATSSIEKGRGNGVEAIGIVNYGGEEFHIRIVRLGDRS